MTGPAGFQSRFKQTEAAAPPAPPRRAGAASPLHEVVVLSGKGGTGKTSLTAALAALMPSPVLVDCDVDAANLHLLLEPRIVEKHAFTSGYKARIDPARCIECGVCEQVCRFGAIRAGAPYEVDETRCEGCGVCEWSCAVQAVSLLPHTGGEWFRSETRLGPLLHARLAPAEESSGKLVSLLRGEARQLAPAHGARWILVDGPPGTGCPAISSLSGASYALLVTEPTICAFEDFRRVAALADHFGVRVGVVVNKADINTHVADAVEAEARAARRDFLGRIPYDAAFHRSQMQGESVVEMARRAALRPGDGGSGFLAGLIGEVWQRLREAVELRAGEPALTVQSL